ncbi:hypothetical protein BR10RB9215_C20641 [Brucella sp. 10RB9215]|nr:hypothetical protein BR10RB9215_C20641 [Brucella sp. 10RB9215]
MPCIVSDLNLIQLQLCSQILNSPMPRPPLEKAGEITFSDAKHQPRGIAINPFDRWIILSMPTATHPLIFARYFYTSIGTDAYPRIQVF